MSNMMARTFVDEQFVADTLGPEILEGAKANNPRKVFKLLLERHLDLLLNTDAGALFIARLAVRIKRDDFRERLAREFGIYLGDKMTPLRGKEVAISAAMNPRAGRH